MRSRTTFQKPTTLRGVMQSDVGMRVRGGLSSRPTSRELVLRIEDANLLQSIAG